MAATWIIQINPAELSLAELLKRIGAGLAEREGEWQIQRQGRQMQAGDRVLFWQSGPAGGMLAAGELLSSAYHQQVEQISDWFVAYRINQQIEPPLTRQELLKQPELKNMSLLRRPQGCCFAVRPEQTEILNQLLARRLQTIPEAQHPRSLSALSQRIRRQGLRLSESLIRRYHLALNSSSLVILAGPSGLGKSWLTRAYAQALDAHYQLVPVAPNWLGPEDLLGYMHPLKQVFMPTVVTRFILQAAENWQHARRQHLSPDAYHLVLDEINLARIEYYLAPFLSLLEVRRRGEPALLTLADGSELLLPPNLSLIGTLNQDETTQPLSDKVCDRAQVIELELDQQAVAERLRDQPWGAWILQLWPELQQLTPFGYRSLEDIEAYILQAMALGVDWQVALDEQLVQKLLPRLRQSRSRDLASLQRLLNQLPPELNLTRQKLESWLDQLQAQGFAHFF